jgi:cation:H+ antiporter
VLGNVMGSNVANLLLILGATGLLRPLDVPEMSVVYTMPIMIFFTLGLLHVMRRGGDIRRGHGVIAVTAYVAFLATAFVQGWG